MRWVIAMTVVLCACGPTSAIEIVVEMPPGDSPIVVDKVQLYVGLGGPENESGKPELLIPRDYHYPDQPDGFYWKRDVNGEQDVLEVGRDANDVRFVFQEGSHDRMTVIVVGYSADKVVAAASLVDAYLDAGSVRQYHVQLKPASDAFPRPTAAPVTVHRWGPGPSDSQCAYLEDPSNTDDRSIFIVDHDDRDCDGVIETDDPNTPNLECLPDVHLGMVRPGRTATRCIRGDVIPTDNAMGCVLGGPGCVDGRGPGGACDPSTTCAIPAACAACAGRTDALDCLANLPQANTTAQRIECTFYATMTTMSLCPTPAPLVQRFEFLPTCNVDTPYLFWLTGQNKWNPQSFMKGGLTFTAAKPTTNCDFSLTATGTAPPGGLAGIRSVLNVQIANGRSAALPIAITVVETTNCDDGSSVNECVIAGEVMPPPSFISCMSSRVVQPW